MPVHVARILAKLEQHRIIAAEDDVAGRNKSDSLTHYYPSHVGCPTNRIRIYVPKLLGLTASPTLQPLFDPTRGDHENINRILRFNRETMPQIEPLRRTAGEDIQAEGTLIGMPPHRLRQDRPAQTLPLPCGIKIEMFDPLNVTGGPYGDTANHLPVNKDELRQLGVEAVEEALAHTHGIVASETLKVFSQHDRSKFGNPQRIGSSGCSQ